MKTTVQILFILLLVSQTAFPQLEKQNLSAVNKTLSTTSTVTNPSLRGPGSIGIRAGIGTDINLGIAYGGGINYLFDLNSSAVELGLVFFGGHSEEETVEFNTYNEKTDVFVFGVLSNYLLAFNRDIPGFFGVLGLGFAAISAEWEESSPDDGSLGTPLPGGGSKQSVDATGAGSVINLGFGISFSGGLDLRIEAPLIFLFGPPGDASSFIPTLMATVGYHF